MKNILIFGGSGAIGRFLIRKLTKNNYRVTVVTRNIHQKGYIIKSQGNAGYIQLEEASIFDEKKIRKLFENAEICINLVGILYERRGGNTFKNIHTIFPTLLAKLCKEYNLKKFVHLSALGINQAIDSDYAKTKLDGEINVLKNFPKTNILRPSIVYSSSDQFTCNFMTLLSRLPVFPLYYNGLTKFMPIHANDLTNVIYHVISKNIETNIIECVGPETFTFKEILKKLLKLIQKKRLLIPLPLPLAKISASILGILPKPLITSDQLRLLKYMNISSGKYKTNFDIGIPSTLLFEQEVEKYCYMWREGGQYSTKKYNLQKND
tara:strand:+ start:41091 stop:42056 length:966 start_codon:yes stop_codon:yes gene_type:complete